MQGKFNQVCCEGGAFKLCQIDMPKLEASQVLIRVSYSSVNQFDKVLMECKSKDNFVLGSEGSGIIEDVGLEIDQSFRGRKVAFCHDGWSQFVVKKLDDLMLLDDKVDLRIAADAITNPMTALSVLKLIRDFKPDSVILDGAQSSLGRMLIQLCLKDNLDIVVIPQDDSYAQMLSKDYGLSSSRIFNYNVDNFAAKFATGIKDYQKCFYISMLGGDIPGKVL